MKWQIYVDCRAHSLANCEQFRPPGNHPKGTKNPKEKREVGAEIDPEFAWSLEPRDDGEWEKDPPSSSSSSTNSRSENQNSATHMTDVASTVNNWNIASGGSPVKQRQDSGSLVMDVVSSLASLALNNDEKFVEERQGQDPTDSINRIVVSFVPLVMSNDGKSVQERQDPEDPIDRGVNPFAPLAFSTGGKLIKVDGTPAVDGNLEDEGDPEDDEDPESSSISWNDVASTLFSHGKSAQEEHEDYERSVTSGDVSSIISTNERSVDSERDSGMSSTWSDVGKTRFADGRKRFPTRDVHGFLEPLFGQNSPWQQHLCAFFRLPLDCSGKNMKEKASDVSDGASKTGSRMGSRAQEDVELSPQ